MIYALGFVFVRDENYRLPPYSFRCDVLNMQSLWRRRINASVFLIYDLLFGKIVSNVLRERIIYTRQQYDDSQRNLRNTELIRVRTFTSDYAQNQSFNVVRQFHTMWEFFCSDSLRIGLKFSPNLISMKNWESQNIRSICRGVQKIQSSTFSEKLREIEKRAFWYFNISRTARPISKTYISFDR